MNDITKLRCPICNAKIKGGKCPYCKITDKQIIYASNKKAKKEVNKKKVYDSTYKPLDVKKSDMVTLTILYGLLGVNSFFVGKKNKGIYQLISAILFFIVCIFSIVFMIMQVENAVFNLFFDLLAINFGISIVMWTLDIFRVCFNKYAYPVVLPDEDKIDVAKEELLLIQEQLNKKNDKYKKPFVKIREIINKIKEKFKSKEEDKLSKKQEKLTKKQQKLDLEKSKLENEIIKNKENIENKKELEMENKVNSVDEVDRENQDLGVERTEFNGKVTERREIKTNKKNRK